MFCAILYVLFAICLQVWIFLYNRRRKRCIGDSEDVSTHANHVTCQRLMNKSTRQWQIHLWSAGRSSRGDFPLEDTWHAKSRQWFEWHLKQITRERWRPRSSLQTTCTNKDCAARAVTLMNYITERPGRKGRMFYMYICSTYCMNGHLYKLVNKWEYIPGFIFIHYYVCGILICLFGRHLLFWVILLTFAIFMPQPWLM